MVKTKPKVGSKLMDASRRKGLMVDSTPKVGSKLMAESRRMVLMVESTPKVGLIPKALMVGLTLMAG